MQEMEKLETKLVRKKETERPSLVQTNLQPCLMNPKHLLELTQEASLLLVCIPLKDTEKDTLKHGNFSDSGISRHQCCDDVNEVGFILVVFGLDMYHHN